MADTKVTGAQSTPAFIERLDVFSNKDQGKTVSIVNGAVNGSMPKSFKYM